MPARVVTQQFAARRTWSIPANGWLFLAIVVAAFALRLGQFGNPIAGLDEQFYLLVGDRMWHGAVPYVDIWDRKPAGLFLLYAAIRVLPGDGVVAYQVVATCSLALTGVVAARITTRTLPPLAGLAVGLAIMLYGVLIGSGFGEAPIFYNLLTVVAGYHVLDVRETPRDAGFDRRAFVAMALCGVALTLKTSAVFESCCFGLLLVQDDWRNRARRVCGMRALIYLAAGLLPTVAFAGFYAWRGDLDAFVFANFRSVFLRGGGDASDNVARCVGLLLLFTPLILPAAAEWRRIPRGPRTVLTAWAVAGVLSFVALGRSYEHYALPLVIPLALLAAYGLRRPVAAAVACAVLAIVGAHYSIGAGESARRDEADLRALLAAIPADVRRHCLFVYEGPVVLYQKTKACLPGRYVFPGHFTDPAEANALEYPSSAVLRDVLARRPAVIVMAPVARDGGAPTGNDLILRDVLRRSYQPIGRATIRLYGAKRIEEVVWHRIERKPVQSVPIRVGRQAYPTAGAANSIIHLQAGLTIRA